MCLPNANSEPVKATIQLGSSALSHLQRPRNVLRSELMKQAVRSAAVLEMWALTVAPAPAASVAALSSANKLGSWLQYQTPTAIGMVFKRHSSSRPVVWYKLCPGVRYVATASRIVDHLDIPHCQTSWGETSCGTASHRMTGQTVSKPRGTSQ